MNPLDSFYLHGLPESAYPAAFHGQDTLPYRELSLALKQKYIEKSCLFDERQDFGKYYFFIQHIDSLYEYEYEWYYNVWMYDASAKKLSRIFSHHVGKYNEMQLDEVHWNFDMQTNDEPYTSASKRKLAYHYQTATPVVVINARKIPATPHSPRLTVIINPIKKTQKVIEEKFVGFLNTEDIGLPVSEKGLTKRMILTTSSSQSSKNLPSPKDVDILCREYLYPSINVYSTNGVRLGRLNLPHDEIDVMR